MVLNGFYRSTSTTLALGGLIFLAWITIVPFGFPGAPIAASLLLILALAFMKLGSNSSPQLWETKTTPSQPPRVALMIAVALGVQLAVGGLFQRFGSITLNESILALAVWTLIPFAAVRLGFIHWPIRRASPSRLELAAVACAALAVAAMLGALSTLNTGREASFSTAILARTSSVAALAAAEEIVFRVLLLTSLLQASRSRMSALIISSFVFGVGHAPLVLAQPIAAMDWPLLSEATKSYLPGLVWQVGVGFLLGALWLRTGSITLISAVHFILNVNLIFS